MKILVDMNLSPGLCHVLAQPGREVIHWSDVGDSRATDREVMRWARENRHIILTHDLDFSSLLAATHAGGPSVIQVRTQDVLPAHLAPVLVNVLAEHTAAIESGAIVVVEEGRARVRILPLQR